MNESENSQTTEPEFHSAIITKELFNPTEDITEASSSVELANPPTNKIHELPETVRRFIKPQQRVINHWHSDFQTPEKMLPPDEALAKLTHSNDGKFGAPDASLPKEGGLDLENLDQGKFAVLFGRDGLFIAELLANIHPEIREADVDKLAEFQAVDDDAAAEKEFGKILHELRFPGDPLADWLSKTRGWKLPYYGAADSTPKFISAMSEIALKKDNMREEYLDQTFTRYEDKKEVSRRESLDNALHWLETNQDSSKDGLISFQRRIPKGIENQILRDSPDSMSDKSGRLANHDRPIAALQAQADAYDAYIAAANLFESETKATGDTSLADRAEDYRRRAQHLHDQVIEQFWIEDERGGYFAVGLDQDDEGNFRTLDTRTNDMAFMLSSKILNNDADRDIVEKLVATLDSDEMKVGSGGLRSLSSLEVNFLPGGYHNGSDWLVVDAKYAEGLLQHGYKDKAIAVYEWIVKACEDTKAYPEYLMGGDSPEPEINTLKVEVSTSATSDEDELNMLMQPPEMGQGWTVAAYILAKHRLAKLLAEQTEAEELEDAVMVA